jgi:hypothetical protein
MFIVALFGALHVKRRCPNVNNCRLRSLWNVSATRPNTSASSCFGFEFGTVFFLKIIKSIFRFYATNTDTEESKAKKIKNPPPSSPPPSLLPLPLSLLLLLLLLSCHCHHDIQLPNAPRNTATPKQTLIVSLPISTACNQKKF